MNTFEEFSQTPHYKKLLEQLSEDEKKQIEKNLQKLLSDFDQSLLLLLNMPLEEK